MSRVGMSCRVGVSGVSQICVTRVGMHVPDRYATRKYILDMSIRGRYVMRRYIWGRYALGRNVPSRYS